MISADCLQKNLQKIFGISSFRPGQLQIIEQILQGNDVFAIMPTGSGKSICFQLPAILLSGITVVVSPLVALMNDQVERLQQLKVNAVFLNKSLTSGKLKKIMSDILKGLQKVKLIYIAPERLESESFLKFASQIKISLVVVDEAHCVLQWGLGFRPSYLKIAQFFEKMEVRPIFAALTATACSESTQEIIKLLKLQKPFVLCGGFDRENLFFDVISFANDYLKIKFLLKIFKNLKNESSIIYCQTRKNVEFVHLVFQKKGFKVAKYHAGLSHEIRRRNQAKFLTGEVDVLVATNAFGMGIDKGDIRNVVHFNMPKNLEDYYQEAGRAGRDGNCARCVMMFSQSDILINKLLIEKSNFCVNLKTSKLNDFKKLEQIVAYSKSDRCYRNQILFYFGENKRQKNCFNCGNCLRNFVNLGEVAVLVLRCVFNANCGLNKEEILKILKGSWFLNKKFKRNATFGKLKRTPLAKVKVEVCIEQLISKKLLVRLDDKGLALSFEAINLLKQRQEFNLWVEAIKIQKKVSNANKNVRNQISSIFKV